MSVVKPSCQYNIVYLPIDKPTGVTKTLVAQIETEAQEQVCHGLYQCGLYR